MAQTREDKIQEEMESPIQLDLNVEFRIPRSNQTTEKKYKCSCCGASWDNQKSHFSKSADVLWQSNDGYLPICNSCRDAYYYKLVDFYGGNESHAIKHFCMQFGWVFDIEGLKAAKQISADRSRISHYGAKKNLGQVANIGKTYFDSMKYHYINDKGDVIETLDDVKDSAKVKLKTVKFWGTGFNDEDYTYLQDQYEDWTNRHECKTKAQEEIFKRICFKQLEILKATRANQSTKDLDATYQNLLATGNLQPKQTNMDALAENRTFGQLIRIWEDEKPIPNPDKEFEDVDGIGKYISVFFLGHLAKMVGIKNRFSRMYDEEMNKYTVKKPEYEEDTEALFDAIFGGHLESSKDTDGD